MTLQDQLAALKARDVPMPLVGMQAVSQAMRLRGTGLTYSAIAIVMREYHGSGRTEEHWRRLLRAQGAPGKHFAASRRVAPKRVRP